jgi:GT2 family glycosyltransferase
MERPLETAVLFLVFNRPETTRRAFEAIRRARPARLYVAADGPRASRPGEAELCEEARRIATAIDWPCEVHELFRPANLGCGAAVSNAIDWFFEHEHEGIILEDDCVADMSFFAYCEALLERYRTEPAVMVISGSCYHPRPQELRASYFFSRYPHIWGWATWRRAWRHNDRKMSRWPELRSSDWLSRIGDGDSAFVTYWKEMFDAVHAARTDTWGYQWLHSCWAQDGLAILSSRNLVKNIGFGDDATHTRGGGWRARLPLEIMSFPLVHPEDMKIDHAADRWMDVNVYGTRVPVYRRILRKVPGLRWGIRQLGRLVR